MPLEFALQHRGLFPDPGPWKVPPAQSVALSHPLGIEALPHQRFIKAKRIPYILNIMVVGETGLGKTTFMNTLFNTDLSDKIGVDTPQSTKTVEIKPTHYELEEDGVTLKLCVIDTPGFGDRLNREADLEPIIEYIDSQFQAYYEIERDLRFRRAIPDTRVHACLYFIPPTGCVLKELDILALQTLSSKVNVIPVIAKADTLTPEEKISFKQAILRDLESNNIKIYPTAYPDDRESIVRLEKHIPFTVIGSDTFVTVGNRKVRGRMYRWGVVEVENEKHCDFNHLRELIMTSCLHELMDISHTHHYHNYRASLLRHKGRPESILPSDDEYHLRIENTKQYMAEDMLRREEEMRQSFVQKVREKETALRAREEEFKAKYQELTADLEEQRRQLEAEEREILDSLNTNKNTTLSKASGKIFGKK